MTMKFPRCGMICRSELDDQMAWLVMEFSMERPLCWGGGGEESFSDESKFGFCKGLWDQILLCHLPKHRYHKTSMVHALHHAKCVHVYKNVRQQFPRGAWPSTGSLYLSTPSDIYSPMSQSSSLPNMLP